jgi:hypothetical protein
LALDDLEMHMVEFQNNSVWMATYNAMRKELEMFEHIPKTEPFSQNLAPGRKKVCHKSTSTLMCEIMLFIIHQI